MTCLLAALLPSPLTTSIRNAVGWLLLCPMWGAWVSSARLPRRLYRPSRFPFLAHVWLQLRPIAAHAPSKSASHPAQRPTELARWLPICRLPRALSAGSLSLAKAIAQPGARGSHPLPPRYCWPSIALCSAGLFAFIVRPFLHHITSNRALSPHPVPYLPTCLGIDRHAVPVPWMNGRPAPVFLSIWTSLHPTANIALAILLSTL
ncbi:uncharacterized protein BKA78DRAFT_116346 [Phyllosticta capitalensis]|uniref:uncharacterized protein n=1 Tax=Phyllosticta capitalensis TaxID=121624 RepID=UPI00312F1E8B